MPASLYPNPASLCLGNLDLIMMESSNNSAVAMSSSNSMFDSNTAAEQIALQLALLQQQSGGGMSSSSSGGCHDPAHMASTASNVDLVNNYGAPGSLEDLRNSQRKSQNMTECVPVPSSEHVAEIVGRQGCKIKALRAKTNTYIKTPVRGEEPVFVVTGRKEDVALAKREILSAADHFSQIRASRKSNINSTLAFGQLMANTPGQTTVQVRVPYRVVGLVVGPKGATIKRIQQQTHTYIVTPSRDKEPIFEVTGLPENVDAARKEIEAHIAIRTGTSASGDFNSLQGSSGYFNLNDNGANDDLFSASGGLNSPFSSSSGNLDHVTNSILNNDFKSSTTTTHHGITLANLLQDSSNNFELSSSRSMAWSNGTDSHDSGIGHSPPFDHGGIGSESGSSAFKSFNLPSQATSANNHDPTLTGIWNELNKVLGGLDLNNGDGMSGSSEINKQFLSIGSRSSLDLGTLGRCGGAEATSSSSSASSMNTANSTTSSCIGRQLSLPTEGLSPSNSLPGFNGILSNSSSNQLDLNNISEAKARMKLSKASSAEALNE